MKKLIAVLIVLASCGADATSTTTASDCQPIYIINVIGLDSVDEAGARQIVQYASVPYERDVGFPLCVVGYEVMLPNGLTEHELYAYDGQDERFHWAERDANRRPPGPFYYYMFPAILLDGERYYGGMAWKQCQVGRNGYAIGQAGKWSSHEPPRPRLQASGEIVLAHELGHGYGAEHEDCSPNIMHPFAGKYADEYAGRLPFLIDTVERIKKCTGVDYSRRLRKKRRKCFRMRRNGKPKRAKACMVNYRRMKGYRLEYALELDDFPIFR